MLFLLTQKVLYDIIELPKNAYRTRTGRRQTSMDDPGSIGYLVAIIILIAILIIEEVVYLVRSALAALTDSRAEELQEHPKKNVQKLIARKDDVFLAISLTSSLMTTLFAMPQKWRS